ncbi:MAG: putative N-acetylmannosamine-6-phosphate 2-epimerase [Oceanospirillaceae bacterium]|nr:putative N-acetylmannosamine-6-phosphate 2-epimerase [Oceanospirillaceae bacterium]
MSILNKLQGALVASCQPIDHGPMDQPQIVAAMALAAQSGGATGLRIEGVDNLRAVRAVCDLPIIAIIKKDLLGTAVRITPLLEHVSLLAEAGADIIAYDATCRERPVSTLDLIEKIHSYGLLAMADCAVLSEAQIAVDQEADIIGTTLSGYTDVLVAPTASPDFDLLRKFSQLDAFIMAEGRFNTPYLAGCAITAGADAVTVGSAITRIENISSWFATEISKAADNSVATRDA